jgi:excisionase family DNA binding protein
MAEDKQKAKGATLSVDEAARLLRIGRSLAYAGVASGAIPSIRIGKRLLIPRAALERMLEGPARKAAA